MEQHAVRAVLVVVGLADGVVVLAPTARRVGIGGVVVTALERRVLGVAGQLDGGLVVIKAGRVDLGHLNIGGLGALEVLVEHLAGVVGDDVGRTKAVDRPGDSLGLGVTSKVDSLNGQRVDAVVALGLGRVEVAHGLVGSRGVDRGARIGVRIVLGQRVADLGDLDGGAIGKVGVVDSGARGDLASISRAVDDILDVDLGLDGVDHKLRRGVGLGLVGSQVLTGDGKRVDALTREGHRSGMGIAVAGPAADLSGSSLVAVTGRDGSLDLEQVRIEVVLLNRDGSRTSSVVILTVLSSLSVPRNIQLRSGLIDGKGLTIEFGTTIEEILNVNTGNLVVTILCKGNSCDPLVSTINSSKVARLYGLPRGAVLRNRCHNMLRHILLNIVKEWSIDRQGKRAIRVVVLTVRGGGSIPCSRNRGFRRFRHQFCHVNRRIAAIVLLVRIRVTGIVHKVNVERFH